MMIAETGDGSSSAAGIMDDDLGMFISARDDDVVIDFDSFWRAMGGPPDPSQGIRLEDLPYNALQGVQIPEVAPSTRDEIPGPGVLSQLQNSEASDSRMGCSDGFSVSPWGSIRDGEKLEHSSYITCAEPSCSRSVTDSIPAQGNGLYYKLADGGLWNAPSYCENDLKEDPFEIPNHAHTFSSPGSNHEYDLFGFSSMDTISENLYQKNVTEDPYLRTSDARIEGSSNINGDRTSHDIFHTEYSSCETNGREISDMLSENDLFLFNSNDPPYLPYSSGFQELVSDHCFMDETKNLTEELVSTMPVMDLVGRELDMHCANNGSVNAPSLNGGVGLTKCSAKAKRKIESNTSSIFDSRDVADDVTGRRYFGGRGDLLATEGMKWSSSNSLVSVSAKNYVSVKDEKEDKFFQSKRSRFPLNMAGEKRVKDSAIALDRCVRQVPQQHDMLQNKEGTNCLKMEKEVQNLKACYLPNHNYQRFKDETCAQSNADDGSDLCILEDMSAPACPNPVIMNSKLVATSQLLTSRVPSNHTIAVNSRHKPNDERVIFRVALQDLSQPKSETTPPDGLLAVPLLKHQRIALSWMVNKETKGACCSGGILADDQGLGKTISTIALILKERSPPSKAPMDYEEKGETETLNLDEDDDGVLEAFHMKEGGESLEANGCSSSGSKTCLQAKGRPAAGTLIVCPTSVLRQWSEELHNKVTSEASLSVLVYHGNNRTKDPHELAKYDVVITTYAIVSMEVPKQPVVNENDDQNGSPSKEFPCNRKRKPEKKSSSSKKRQKGVDNELLETISGPLAKVGWFRVVLDEAQSIKNHRTQVARACWGLRAKRRWCLSGTPIQNAIDDLYSYFRFLRHEPYAVFRTFCDQLKAPIHRNPKNGYKKLQAVLKTIMLRRTKGTFLDGEPIINLPPKTIELKKIDFSKEERDFYGRLEADSRAQFAEYAAAGTVKQNYVNILLMLLRLRQACDHPLLVKGLSSNSNMTSSIEAAKDLPREKQLSLLNCLEASLAICGICSDPPEDAVVTVCGHVFCNQCICEHIIGDANQCPTKNCKTHLSMSCVFSTTTLHIALSDKLSIENTPDCSDSQLAQVSQPRSSQCPQDSSKIRAALELLLSLSKPKDCEEKLNNIDSEEDKGTSDMSRDLNSSVKVVGQKAIVFSQWTRMLDLLEERLKTSSIQYRRLDGTMPVTARDRAVKDFNTLPEVTVMIMSLKAASLGLNMVAACNVLLLDLWWNPTTEDQAIDRAHRIGQTRPVSVFRLTVKDTVEDRILALQQRKRKMVASAFGENETGSRQTRLTVEDLKYLFRA